MASKESETNLWRDNRLRYLRCRETIEGLLTSRSRSALVQGNTNTGSVAQLNCSTVVMGLHLE